MFLWRRQLQTELVLADFGPESEADAFLLFRPAPPLGKSRHYPPFQLHWSAEMVWDHLALLLSYQARSSLSAASSTLQSDTVWNSMNKERKNHPCFNFISSPLLTGQASENIEWARWHFPQTSIVGSLRDREVAVGDPECATGGGVSHILAEKRDVSFTLFKKMHENSIYSPIMGGGVCRVRPMLDPPLGSVLGLRPPGLEFRILCHLNHLTILRRLSWPTLAYMCTKVA